MSAAKKTLDLGYRPRPLQDVLHKKLKRFNVIVAHRRFGKTWFCFAELIHQALSNRKRDPQYFYVAPTYGQAKRVAWDVLKRLTENVPNRTVNEADLRVEILRPWSKDKIKITLLGAENPDSHRGVYADGVILDEFGVMNPRVWDEIFRAALSDRLGWSLFIGTPNGKNKFKDLFDYALHSKNDEWFCALYRASETGIVPQSELDAAKATMSEEAYAQEFECDWGAALRGAYYGKEITAAREAGRITKVSFQKQFPVYTSWDLGMDDSTAIWVAQAAGKDLHFIDYIENSGEGLDWYVNELRERGYISYENNFFPHDVAVRELSNGGKSREFTLRDELKFSPINIVPKQNPEDGIHAVRLLLAKSWFDEEKCARGIEALENYQRKWDDKNQLWMSRPLHNWASHGADAMRVFAMGFDDNAGRYKYDPKNGPLVETDYDIYNY